MPPLLRVLTQNWKLKLLAIALAVLLWVVVSAEQVTSNWIPVPLTVRVDDPQYRLVEGSKPAEVEVRFTGPGRELWDLVIRRPPLLLAVENVGGTEGVFNLEPRMVQVPNQLSVSPQDVRPSAVALRFERMATRAVPVRVRVGRSVGEGRTLLDSLRVEPAAVRLTGPRERIAAVTSISTRPLDLSGMDSSFVLEVGLETGELAGVRLSATRVRVAGEVDRLARATMAAVPVSVGPGIVIEPASVDLNLEGPERTLRTVGRGALRVAIAIDSIPDQIPPEGIPVPLRVERVPPGIQAEPEPRRVRLFPLGRVEPGSPELASPDSGRPRPGEDRT